MGFKNEIFVQIIGNLIQKFTLTKKINEFSIYFRSQPFEKQVNSKKKFVKNKKIKNEKRKIKKDDNKILKNELPCLVVKAFKKTKTMHFFIK